MQLNRKFRFFLFSFFFFLVFFISKGQSSSSRSHYEETMVMAEVLLNRGFFSEALANFEIVAVKSKNRGQRANALFFKGKINSIYLDQQEKALQLFNRILTTYPESSAAPDAFFESGIIFFDRKNYEKAH